MNDINPPGNVPAEAPPAPAPGSRPKTNAGLFILGFLAALVLYGAY